MDLGRVVQQSLSIEKEKVCGVDGRRATCCPTLSPKLWLILSRSMRRDLECHPDVEGC
jgi:hypothetical protein